MVPETIHLHPEFTGTAADITLLAGHTGFRVNRSMLAMASPVFARMVRDAALSANIVDTGDQAAELYAFLKLMRIGPSRPAAGATGGSTESSKSKAKEGSTGAPLTPSVGEEGGGKTEGPERPKKSELRERRLSPVTEETESVSSKSSSDKPKPKPLSDSSSANTPKPRILVSRPGTGVKALDRALRDAQAKASGTGVKKKKSRVRFQDPKDVPPVPPVPVSSPVEAQLPPSHPFGTAVPRSPTSSITLAPLVRSRSGSSSSGSGSSGIEVTVEPPSPPRPDPVPLPAPPTPTTAKAAQEGGPAAPAAFEPSIPQLLQIHALTSKYPGFYTHAVLDFHVELNAPSIVASLGSSPSQLELFRLLELTHRLRSSKLWSLVLGKLASEAWWRAKLDPWSFGEVEVGVLGQDLFSVLAILAAVHVSNPAPPSHHPGALKKDGKAQKDREKKDDGRQKDGTFSQVDKVCITYDEGELQGIERADDQKGKSPSLSRNIGRPSARVGVRTGSHRPRAARAARVAGSRQVAYPN